MAVSRKWRSRIVLSLVLSLVTTCVLGITSLFFGLISGEEVMPDTFARRKFFYWEIPLVHVQVWPITRKDSMHPFAAWLATKGYVKRVKDTSWDLVAFSRSGVPVVEGDARILCAYLDSTTNDNRYYWQVWSQDHPKLAAVLWPRISSLARRGLYLAIPDLMEIAAGATDLTRFTAQVNKRTVEEYAAYAERRVGADDHKSAAEALSAALALDPENRKLLEARAAAYDQLSEDDKAASDRAKLSELDK